MQLAQPIARRGEHFSFVDLNFLVDSRRENTFGLQARQQACPATHTRKNATGSAYVHARAVHTVCTNCAHRARALCGVGVPAPPNLDSCSAEDGDLLLALMLCLHAAASRWCGYVSAEARSDG